MGLKLITETSYDLEPLQESKKDKMYLVGIFSSAEVENNNKRRYPKDILEREIEKVRGDKIKNKSCYGELNHPASPDVNLDRVAIMVEDLEWKNNDVYGRAKVLDTPLGQIVKTIISEGGRIGISSRGLGTVNEEGWVNEDFNLITYDIVSNPSNMGSWVNGVYEGADFTPPGKGDEVEKARKEWKKKVYLFLDEIEKNI